MLPQIAAILLGAVGPGPSVATRPHPGAFERLESVRRAPDAQQAPDLDLETVLPQLPGKNRVRWWEFDWKESDFHPVEGAAPVRLYFYASERNVAEAAAPLISDAYRDFVKVFDDRPSQRIPFLLYNSHAEFQSTTAFLISEGILGVTSPEDLRMAVPYWGEYRRFVHVMRHELAHQFTIQKLLGEARAADSCNPIALMPLWFIEGIAEHVSLGHLTPEVRAVLADRLINAPNPEEKQRKLPRFFEDGEGTFERVYLIGHAQINFLETEFGEGTFRKILETSPRMCSSSFFPYATATAVESFRDLIAQVAKVEPQELEKRWQAYVERTVAPARGAAQTFEAFEELERPGLGEIDSFSLSPDGRTLFFRTFDRDTGVSRLYLSDVNDPRSLKRVTEDDRLGMESLHPLDRRVTAVGSDRAVWIGRSGSADKLFVRKFRRVEGKNGRVRFELSDGTNHDLVSRFDLIEAGHPAVDPKTGAVAFVGLSRTTGILDIYELDEPLDHHTSLRRLTSDYYAEKDLAFDPEGQLYFTSDATPDGHDAIARLEGGKPRILTAFAAPADAGSPMPTGPGAILFHADPTGWTQAYWYRDGAITRVTDAATMMRDPALDPQGNLVGIALIDQHLRLVRLPREKLLAEPVDAVAQGSTEGFKLERSALASTRDYKPLSNLSLAGALAALAGTSAGYAQLIFTDLFRMKLVGGGASFIDDLDRTSADIFYFDQSGRWTFGAVGFIETALQIQPTPARLDPDAEDLDFYYLRRYGVRLLGEYPFGRYTRVEGFISPQGLRAYDFDQPDAPFATENRGTFPALEAGARLHIDATRLTLLGPVGGWSLGLDTRSTLPFGASAFGLATGELVTAKTLLRGRERFFGKIRLAGGTTFGKALTEQFYLPAAFNLRAFPEGDLQLLGEHYYLGQAEVHFPLAPVLAQFIYLQGLVAFDVGSIFFERSSGWSQRVADLALGVDVGLGGFLLGVNFARPIDIGAGVPVDRWVFHLSLSTPLGAF